MATVCETCGDVGYEHLLLSCDDCKCAMHQYCLAKILLDGSSLERWLCNQCLQRRGEVTYEESLHKASNHANSGSAVRQASITSVESTKGARPYRSKRSKTKTYRKRYSSSKNSFRRKHGQERSDMPPVGYKTNRRDCNAPNISCASEKALHSCEVIAMEISKASEDEKQVDDEHSVRTNNDCRANCLPARINKSISQKPLEEFEPPLDAAEQLKPPKDSDCIFSGNVEMEYPKGCRVTPVLAGENQNELLTLLDRADSSSLSETTSKQNLLLKASDTVVERSDTVQNCVKDNPRKRRQLILLDDEDDGEEAADVQSEDFDHRADSCSLSEITLKKNVILEASDTDVVLPGTVQNSVKDNPRNRRQLILLDDDDDDGEVAVDVESEDFNHQVDSSSFFETTLKQNVLLEAIDTAVELPDTVQNCVEENPRKRRQLILLDDDDDGEEAVDVQSEDFYLVVDSSSLSETTLKQNVLLETSDKAVELSDTVQNCGEDNPRKRRQLILLDDDDDGEEATDVQSGYFNHRPLGCDGSLSNYRIDTEKSVHTGELNAQNLSVVQLDILIPGSSEITQPVKKRRTYTPANEDDEDGEVIIGTNNALNDVSKLTSETLVAKDYGLQSRFKFDSESANQQRCMFSQPIDEPIWSGILKINNEVFVSLVAHMSSNACGVVWELSMSLQPVVEVIKLPQLEAWPKSWKASGPTDGDIALYFFAPNMSRNEESDVLVEEIIGSGAAIKAVVGVAELLIFPSTILPEQYHVCEDKHYLWGVFKRREDEADKDVLVEEQDASAHAEEGEIQEHHFMDQQYGVQCKSPDRGSSFAKQAIHVENQFLAEHNCEVQEGATKATMGEDLASLGNNSFSVKPNPPEARSSCFMEPRSDPKLHVSEEVDNQEDEQNFTEPSADPGPAATTAKSIDSAERGVPPTTQLFGFVAAQTPRARQLIQEMVSEGALLFSVAEESATFGSTAGNDTGAQARPSADGECSPAQECCQSIGFIPLDDDVASEACMELFPVRQEHIGWTTRVEASKEVDLDLSLSVRLGEPLGSFL